MRRIEQINTAIPLFVIVSMLRTCQEVRIVYRRSHQCIALRRIASPAATDYGKIRSKHPERDDPLNSTTSERRHLLLKKGLCGTHDVCGKRDDGQGEHDGRERPVHSA